MQTRCSLPFSCLTTARPRCYPYISFNCKPFVRKLVGPTLFAALADATAARTRGHENIVHILGHGKLQTSTGYYMDMELCEYNLETYIKLLWHPSHLELMLWKTASETLIDVKPRLRYIWIIMAQIGNGLNFLHCNGQIHGNLKPRNGYYPHWFRVTYSALFRPRRSVEDS